jgi:hypothetical protein
MKRSTQLDSHASTTQSTDPEPPPVAEHVSVHSSTGLDAASYGQDLEERYVAAREAWTQAMQAAGSGRPADMASLAIAQQAYETIAAEREDWLANGRVAIPIEPPPKRHDIEVAVGQELAWRRVQQQEGRNGLFTRIRRRLSRH